MNAGHLRRLNQTGSGSGLSQVYGRKYADIQIYTVSFQIASLVQNAVALPPVFNTHQEYKPKL